MSDFINLGNGGIIKLKLERQKIFVVFVITAITYSKHFDIKRAIIPKRSFYQLINVRNAM